MHTSEKNVEHVMCEVSLGIRHYELTVDMNRQRLVVEVEGEMVLSGVHCVSGLTLVM